MVGKHFLNNFTQKNFQFARERVEERMTSEQKRGLEQGET
jgi:hypothetical protein